MKKTLSYIVLVLVITMTFAKAADKIVCAPEKLADWEGNNSKLLCKDGIFDTNRSQFLLYSKEKIKIIPGKSYELKGDFKLKTYAPFGNIRLGLKFFNKDGKAVGQETYIAASPYDDRVPSGNRAQVKRFWMTFSGRIPSEKNKIPKKAIYMKIMLQPHNINIVDMIFKNIKLIEKD